MSNALETTAKMPDGLLHAGLTADGKAWIFAMSNDPGVLLTSNKNGSSFPTDPVI